MSKLSPAPPEYLSLLRRRQVFLGEQITVVGPSLVIGNFTGVCGFALVLAEKFEESCYD